MYIVITSVDYADYLAVTLPKWISAFPDARIIVLTGTADHLTRGVVACSLGVDLYPSEKFNEAGAYFKRAAALDEVLFGFREGSVVVSVDADTVPHGRIPTDLKVDTIYGCARYDESGNIIRPRSKKHPSSTPEECARRCLGFFQLFRYSKTRKFGSYPTCGKYDVEFAKQFPNRVGLTDFFVTHIGGMEKANWKGRTLPPLRQPTS